MFSFLEFDTGYTRDNYIDNIFFNCNSGMKNNYNDNPYIVKNPVFMSIIEKILKDTSVKTKIVIIPIRDFKLSAISRVKHNDQPGGLWHCNR